MLDETRALDALRRRYRSEPDAGVRTAIAWAGGAFTRRTRRAMTR
jgi:hypothetical protein